MGFFCLQWAVVAIGEETLYRGGIQRYLARAFHPSLALLIASAIWAFAGHVRAPLLENLVLRLPAGLVLGWVYMRSKSLQPAILSHWVLSMMVTFGL